MLTSWAVYLVLIIGPLFLAGKYWTYREKVSHKPDFQPLPLWLKIALLLLLILSLLVGLAAIEKTGWLLVNGPASSTQ